jgi:hypothetical protein
MAVFLSPIFFPRAFLFVAHNHKQQDIHVPMNMNLPFYERTSTMDTA